MKLPVIRELFKQTDTDNNGKISLDELEVAMENNPELPKLLRKYSNHSPVGEALTSPMKAVIKEIFPSLPSKEVNFEEFSAALERGGAEPRPGSPRASARVM